ncbi:MAG: amidohydrolase family protein [bacterium]|jgi:imidazolonepropionase-like amidohydrolase
MKTIFTSLITFLAISSSLVAQENIYPAKEQQGPILIKNGTIHVGNGQVLDNTSILIQDGKIKEIGNLQVSANNAIVVDAKGKHVYPGLILSNSSLGLVEVSSVRATSDVLEIGEYNPSIRSLVAYNTDSKVINTLKTNGITHANIVPQGGIISGSSSVVQLDAWNWEDAAYSADKGIHLNMPRLYARPNPYAALMDQRASTQDPVKKGLEEIESIKQFFREAKAYGADPNPLKKNLKLEAVQGLFSKKQTLYIHCDVVREILAAIDLKTEFDLEVVLVGASESYQIADLLKRNNIPVIINQMHALPTLNDDGIDQPYRIPAELQKAGVLFAINDEDGQHRGKNLPFNAGTAAAYGLTKEEALAAITLNPAKILGIADKTGSIEKGKDANIVISEGDILDMRTSLISLVMIEGRVVSLTDKHKQLYERYKVKYGLK